MNKKLKIGIGLSAALIVTSATIPLAVTLSSCSSTKKPKYEYDSTNNALVIDSSALFGNHNIFYGFQKIKYDTEANTVSNKYDLVAAINKLVEPTYGPNLIKELNTQGVESSSDNPFTLKVGVVGALNKKFIRGVPTVENIQEVLIKFPEIKDKDLPWQSPIEVQAGVYFGNDSIQDVMSWPVENIVSAIGNSIIPEGATIGPEKRIIDGQTKMELDLFIPNSGISKLIINFQPLEVPKVNPSTLIANANIQSNWQSIVNWSPELPANIPYSTLVSPTGQSNLFNKPILSSYSLAIQGSELLKKFDSSFYTNVENKSFNMRNLKEDVDYFIKNYLADVANTWEGQNILNSNVYAGNNLVANNGKLNGNIGIQFQNTSNKTQTLTLPITKQTITVNANSVVSILIKLNDSVLSPYLIQKNYKQNTAYLTTAFSNVSMMVSVDDQLVSSSNSGNQAVNIFPYSIVLKTIVANVKDGQNYISETNKFEELYNEEFGQAVKSNSMQEVYQQAIINDVQNSLNKMNTIVGAIQGIAFKWAANPTILEFLQEISEELYNLLYSITNNNQLSKIVSSIFSEQPISVFLYFNWRNVVDLLEGLNIPSLQTQIDSLVNLIQQIGNENTTLPEMKQWVENVSSLYSTLEKVFAGNPSMSWLLPLFKHLMDTLSTDPSIVHFVFMNLNSIFDVLGNSDKAPAVVKAIVKGLNQYLVGLVAYSEKNNKQNSKNLLANNDPNDLDKFNTIRVMDPILWANSKNKGYKSIFSYLSESFADINKTASTILKIIGLIFENTTFKPSNNALTVTNIQNSIKDLFSVSISSDNKKESKNITILDLLENHLVVKPIKSKDTLSFSIYFDSDITWDFTNIRKVLNSGRLVFVPIVFDYKLPVGNLLFPKQIVLKRNNSIALDFSVQTNYPITPEISKGELYWKFRTQKILSFNTKQLIEDMNSQFEPADFSKLGNLLDTILSAVGIKNTNFKKWLKSVNLAQSMFDLFFNNILKNGLTQNTWIYIKSKLDDKSFDHFDSLAGLPGISFEPNKKAGFLESNFRTWLKSQIISNVKWKIPSNSNGDSQPSTLVESSSQDTSTSQPSTTSTVPVMTWTKPSNFDAQLAKYFNFGDLFSQNEAYPFIDWSTDLGAFRMTIGSDLYSIYDFHINFSTPTVVKNALGKYSVKDRVDYFFIQKEPKTNNSSRN